MSRLHRVFGDVARARGELAEHRVLDAVGSLREPWLRGVRAATREEDQQGIDVVVFTDVGALHLQVKCSRAGLQRWHAKNRRAGLAKQRAHIGLIRAHEQLRGEALARVVHAELLRLRAARLKARGV